MVRDGRWSGRWRLGLGGGLLVAACATLALAGTGPDDDVELGVRVYGTYCANCHGEGAGGLAEFDGDLARFRQSLAGTQGMPDVSRVLEEDEVLALFTYLRSTQGR